MAEKLQLAAQMRSPAAQSQRRGGALPAVLYGHGIQNKVLTVDRRQFVKVFRAAGYTSLINLTVQENEGESGHTVLVREVQVHPVRSDIIHADFYQVRLDETITARVPLIFTGESPAVKDLGGIIVRNVDDVEITALPQNLPHDITVDISALTDYNAPLRVRDLRLPVNVECRLDADTVVVLVQKPRSEEELKAELAEAVTEDVASVEGVAAKPEEETASGSSQAGADKTNEAKQANKETRG